MDWTGANKRKLREVLIAIYNSPVKLAKFVSDELNQNLNQISTESSLDDRAFELIETAESGDWLDNLYQKLCQGNSRHARIAQLQEDLGDTLIDNSLKEQVSPHQVFGEPNSGTVVARVAVEGELIEDPRSAHLVIAVFREGTIEQQQFRVQPKLCYRNGETREILQESLGQNDCSTALKDFPVFLEELVDRTHTKLLRLFSHPIHPWKLTIELFVPTELLRFPLTTWCGQDSELLQYTPMVVGCSDRYESDPTKSGERAKLHNQLKHGWRRFRDKVPDQVGSTLQNLSWLKSDIAHQKVFVTYSGFQCYGSWLKPDEQSLNNWKELVKSGIPLALWMCEGQPEREAIAATFNRLIDGTRFELLDQIPIIRAEQQRSCNHCVGVFYEDLNYVPDVPPVETQFFSW